MNIAFVVVTVLAALWVGFSAVSTFTRAAWVVEPLADYGVPRAWWPGLATVKTAGALGMLAGLFVPALGVAAAIGLIVYFLGAVATVLRARAYAHIAYPLLYLVPVVAALVLGYVAA
ncbi:DoxX family protein [Nocardia sp. NPDC048505]|uniref:DoxX family protein n=1 Tax=unclassified Nocardia TaxID=2637762 RepID=UPI0033D6A33F